MTRSCLIIPHAVSEGLTVPVLQITASPSVWRQNCSCRPSQGKAYIVVNTEAIDLIYKKPGFKSEAIAVSELLYYPINWINLWNDSVPTMEKYIFILLFLKVLKHLQQRLVKAEFLEKHFTCWRIPTGSCGISEIMNGRH